MRQEPSTFEAKVLETLDRCLLKMSETLDSRFDPNNQDLIKLLKLFRSTLSVRRMWAKVFNLLPLPTSRGSAAHSHPLQSAPASASLSQLKALPVVSSNLEKVKQTLFKPITETPSIKNGLLCPQP